ncbi:zinc-binding dehydrogenase [Flagellimonas hadalis]|uniref:alcohol dehydrogenase n=1 Tax=Flagellimonas hadalis TaxID=2597517 RepID=A0A5N5IUJ0_9FLAO|nr:zinc-binding dehydrogenase [Allomuricauda hadalis]KAB5491435.1 zinc-binding dehydrogenase [Allomuricauda hadalis]
MKHTAKAMVFEGVEIPFAPYHVELPKPLEGEVLVEISFSTICTSDLHSFFGRRESPCPCILGHEIMGRVIAVGLGGASDFSGKKIKRGDRITWSVYAYDHNDPTALKGYPQKSQNLYKYGHEKFSANNNLNGGFASHCLLEKGTCIYSLPDKISDKEAAPLNCSHATMVGALRMAGDVKGKNIAVIGVGMLGLSACAMARENGAANVVAIDLNTERLAKSLQFGANTTIDSQKDIKEWALTVKGLGGLDVILDTSGNPTVIENGISLLNIGGSCIIVGAVYSQRNLSIDAETIVRRILTIRGLHNYVPEDLYIAIRFMLATKHKYPFESLVSVEYPLEELDKAFELADKGQAYRVGIYPTPTNKKKMPIERSTETSA